LLRQTKRNEEKRREKREEKTTEKVFSKKNQGEKIVVLCYVTFIIKRNLLCVFLANLMANL